MAPFASVLTRFRRGSSVAPEGSVASGQTLGEVASLSPDEALKQLLSTANGLSPDQVGERLRSVGPNQVAHEARHTILSEVVGRSINPLNLLLLALATASYFPGDQRAAIMIAVMVILSISLGFIQDTARTGPLTICDGWCWQRPLCDGGPVIPPKSTSTSRSNSSCLATLCCCRPET
jgi:P-type Mg2+ transporter